MVLAPAERLDALVAADASDANRFSDGCRANKADTCDVRMINQTVNNSLAAEHNVENALRKASAGKYLSEAECGRRIALTRLEDNGVAASERHCALHDGDQHREVKGTDRHNNSDGKANLHRVNATRHARAERATVPTADRCQLAQHLDGTIDLSASIGEGLAQFGNHDIDKFMTGVLERTAQFEHYSRAILQPQCGPSRKGSAGGSDGPIDLSRCTDCCDCRGLPI